MQTGWNASLATGINLVDNEHQEIFRQAALMSDAMREGKGKQELKKIIDFLDDYVVTHFAHEEKLMDQYRCPIAQTNKKSHNQFIAKFKELKNKFDSTSLNTVLVLEISNMIKDWLIQHIKQIDTQLGVTVKNATKEPAPASR
jgi:hemerythrin